MSATRRALLPSSPNTLLTFDCVYFALGGLAQNYSSEKAQRLFLRLCLSARRSDHSVVSREAAQWPVQGAARGARVQARQFSLSEGFQIDKTSSPDGPPPLRRLRGRARAAVRPEPGLRGLLSGAGVQGGHGCDAAAGERVEKRVSSYRTLVRVRSMSGKAPKRYEARLARFSGEAR